MAKPYRARRWRPLLPDPAACLVLSRELNLSPIIAQLLYNRGLSDPAAAHAFLTAGREQILDPFLLKDMDRAVQVVKDRIASGRPIMIYGDYDADGVTGTTILVLALRALGATVEYYIPNRFTEGYGLNMGALEEIKQRGHDFVLSVDTGVTAVKEAMAAREMGITLVISDHHEPGPELPDVPALINPKRPDCTYPFKGLSGVGVAFKLALALGAPNAWDLLDIVTLGTIADMVPLIGENRAIVREGLALLGSTQRPGLRALMEIAGVKQPVTATHIGFALGPRINALGRMGSAMEGVELLITDDEQRGRELAQRLDEENRSRQEVEASILEEALRQAEGQSPHEKEYVVVLAGEGWHHGVVGICSSRVTEAFYRPSILLSIEGEEARGSARSIRGFHLHRALSKVSDLFAKFGGHAAAAGMTLKRADDIPLLRQRLNQIASEWLHPDDLTPQLRIDAFLGLEEVNDHLMADLRLLEPHGEGNPAPVFAMRDLTVFDSKTMGKEQQHIKLLLKGAGVVAPMEAVGWNMASVRPSARSRTQVAFHPEVNTYMGRTKIQLTMKDVQVIESPDDNGTPVDVAPQPDLTPSCLDEWDPLARLDEPVRHQTGPVIDARGGRLATALESMSAPPAEAAATSELEEEAEQPEPTRLLYLEALARPAGSRVLVLVSSPWAAAALFAELRQTMPDRREEVALWLPGQSEPSTGSIVVAPFGAPATAEFTETVLYHPPYHAAQMPPGRVHLLWLESEWTIAEAALGWVYPDRETLVQTYKLMRTNEASADRLARALREIPGPWNALRLAAAEGVFLEMRLLDETGRLRVTNGGAKFDLEGSSRYRRGVQGRSLLLHARTNDWTNIGEAL